MKWIIEKYPHLKQINVKNPDEEHHRALALIRNFQPVGNQFVYAVSYFDQKLIYLSDSVESVLGYKKDQISEVMFFYDLVHPDDIETVKKMTLHAISIATTKNRLMPMAHLFHLSYRMKKKDGSYIKVQRQTGLLTRDDDYNLLTTFGIFTDITHLNNSEEIQTLLIGPEIPGFTFTNPSARSKVKYTRREKELIDLLASGLNSEQIARKLYISKETVYTHRKNILEKTAVKNSSELMAYVFKNGY